jgi:hypothetical protein
MEFFWMSPQDRDDPERASPQPAPKPVIHHERARCGWPHPCRSFHAELPVDPIARLEWLDDLMFAAIDGDPTALDYAAEAWQKAQDDLGVSAVEESRRQYLRHAQTVWYSLRSEPNHPPHKVFAAIEIISLLAHRER